MTYLLRMFGGDYWKALAGYNGGEGNVQRGTISSAARRYATEILAQAGRGSSQGSTNTGGVPSWADYCDADGFCYGLSWEQPEEPSKASSWLLPVGIAAVLLIVLTR